MIHLQGYTKWGIALSTPQRRGRKWGIVLLPRRPKRLNNARSLSGVREPANRAQAGYRIIREWELAKHD